MLAYVLNIKGEPLMPCSPRKARELLREGKAKVMSRLPFTIQLIYGSSGYKQSMTLSIDSGSTVLGAAATGNGKTYYASQVKLRQDMSKKLQQRASFRRTRRGRKTRYRKARWANRRRKEGWYTPTMQSKVHAHVREVRLIQAILPITRTIIETASFDIHKLVHPNVQDYQAGRQKDFYNTKQFVLYRDQHTCQACHGKSKDVKLHVHHIVFRSLGGADSPDNLVTLCSTCHAHLHQTPHAEQASVKLRKRQVSTRDAVQVSTLRVALKHHLSFKETFGYETKLKREALNLKKEHYIDAICAGLAERESIELPKVIYQKVCISKGDYQQTTGYHSEKPIPTGKIMGFKKFDTVLWNDQTLFIKGRMSTGYAILMDINGKKVDLKPIPKLSKMKRLSARTSCLILPVHIANLQSNITSSLSANTENHVNIKGIASHYQILCQVS